MTHQNTGSDIGSTRSTNTNLQNNLTWEAVAPLTNDAIMSGRSILVVNIFFDINIIV